MTTPPLLFDRQVLALRRARALGSGAPALFLHETVRAEAEERLNEVNRAFTAPVIVTPFADVWSDFLPGARIVADDEVLDLEEGAHDLVIHGLALHWANDPVGQMVQARRALKPDGFFLGALSGGRTLHELRAALANAEAAILGGLSPRVAPMGEIRDLGGLIQRAGLALPVADSLELTATYQSALHLMHDLRAMGETNALAARDRRIPPRAFFAQAAAFYAAHFPAEGDRIAATFELVFLSGWAPAETQQKPLRPGSAAARLADALGTREEGAGDQIKPPQD